LPITLTLAVTLARQAESEQSSDELDNVVAREIFAPRKRRMTGYYQTSLGQRENSTSEARRKARARRLEEDDQPGLDRSESPNLVNLTTAIADAKQVHKGFSNRTCSGPPCRQSRIFRFWNSAI
jgi:hypothetical protein